MNAVLSHARCDGRGYMHIATRDGTVVKSCAGCQDCKTGRRLGAALEVSFVPRLRVKRDARIDLLERKTAKLEQLLSEALGYVDASSAEAADLRARISRAVR